MTVLVIIIQIYFLSIFKLEMDDLSHTQKIKMIDYCHDIVKFNNNIIMILPAAC